MRFAVATRGRVYRATPSPALLGELCDSASVDLRPRHAERGRESVRADRIKRLIILFGFFLLGRGAARRALLTSRLRK